MSKDKNLAPTTTSEKTAMWATTSPLLSAMYREIQDLAKNKKETTLSKNKVTLINRLLTDIRQVLADEQGAKYLDLLNDEELPQYSDVVLILSQYSASMHSFRDRYYRNYSWQTSQK